jgi:Ca2+-binding EF-hand superfamily protein
MLRVQLSYTAYLSTSRKANDGLEFRVFVENTEKELLALFKSIDRDDDGRLDKSELRGAFNKAGLSVPAAKLDQLFAEVDQNSDVGQPKHIRRRKLIKM